MIRVGGLVLRSRKNYWRRAFKMGGSRKGRIGKQGRENP